MLSCFISAFFFVPSLFYCFFLLFNVSLFCALLFFFSLLLVLLLFFHCSFTLMFFPSLLYASLLPCFGVPFFVISWFCCSFALLHLDGTLGILLIYLCFFVIPLFRCSTFAYFFLVHIDTSLFSISLAHVKVLEFEAQFNL